ncbi:MAG TPA: tetratricopeptide repeat protein [Blastocatellia bacterium]|nr:tetratricopeptide repeat protein [Blastocatellia bacterium]
MNIRALLRKVSGRKRTYDANGCPDESGILAYAEAKFTPSERAGLETHLAKCDDCRELLALTSKEDSDARTAGKISDKEVKQQTARILAYVELDEARRNRPDPEATRRPKPARRRLSITYPKLASVALVVCSVAAGSLLLIPKDRRAEEAAAALRVAMKHERRNKALISGDIDYSRHSSERGVTDRDDLNYELALNKVKSADKDTAPTESRHMLARVLVAMGGSDNARKALPIFVQLEAAGVQSAELFNDRGVAEFELGHYTTAVDYFTRALNKSPDSSRFLFNRGLAEQKANLAVEATADLNKFISLTSDERLKAEARDQLDLLR